MSETQKKKVKHHPIGYLHSDFAEVPTEEGKQHLFSALDRTSKRAFAELHPQATQAIAVEFLRRVLPQIPYKVHKLFSDNGIQFRNLPHHVHVGRHPVGQLRDEWSIEQRFTKPAHLWTNGQVERMNRTVKEATIKRFHYETTDQLNTHLQTFLQESLCGLLFKIRAFVCEISPVWAADEQVVQPAGHDHDRIAKPVAAQAQLVAHQAQAFDAPVHVLNHHAQGT